MPNEPIYVSPELKKRLIREANEANLTLDEYIASNAGEKGKPSNNSGSSNPVVAAPVSSRATRTRERLEELEDLWMMRAASAGQAPGGGADPAIERLATKLERIEERLQNPKTTGGSDDLGMDSTIRSAIKYRMMVPIMKAFGSGEDGEGSKASREYEKEMRERVEKVQAQMVQEMRDKDKELAGIREKASEERLVDFRSQVASFEKRIGDLTEQIRSAPLGQQGSVAAQLTDALTQAAAVQKALDDIAHHAAPPRVLAAENAAP